MSRLTRCLPLPLVLLATLARAAPAPCGGLELKDGKVSLATPLGLEDLGTEAGTTCLRAIAQALRERPDLISATVIAQTPNDRGLRDKGLEVARKAADLLGEAGLARHLVSVMAPAGRPNETPGLAFRYVERRPARAIAQVQTVSGRVDAGRQRDHLRAAEPGLILTNGAWLETGAGSLTTLKLLDDTRLVLSADSLLRIDDVAVEPSGRRKASLELARGECHLLTSKREGPLHVMTDDAVVVLRDANARVAKPGEGRTRVEALDGTVVFGGRESNLFVPRGKGSRLDKKARPEEPRALLTAPLPVAPLMGTASAGDLIAWRPVGEVRAYRVELAQDAQFTMNWRVFEVSGERLAIADTLPWGKWFWRVTAIDVDGVAGHSSKVYSFENQAAR